MLVFICVCWLTVTLTDISKVTKNLHSCVLHSLDCLAVEYNFNILIIYYVMNQNNNMKLTKVGFMVLYML